MLKLSVNDIVKHNENCYSFVIAVAKRAREIAEQAEDEEVLLEEQQVQIAVREFVEGKFHIEEDSEWEAGPAEPEEPESAQTDDRGRPRNGAGPESSAGGAGADAGAAG